VPKEMLTRIDEALKGYQGEFSRQVGKFISGYEQERLEARQTLGELFNATDYPIDVAAKFRFEWRFLTMDVPGKSTILSAEVYEREREKFVAMMEETRELAIGALREEFAGIIHHMADRLSGEDDGKPKRFKSSMLEKMHEFLGCFDERNLFDDESLAELVNRAREVVSGVSADNLREHESLRIRIAKEVTHLRDNIDKAMEDIPRRRIRLAA
jgi:hypothetical protein